MSETVRIGADTWQLPPNSDVNRILDLVEQALATGAVARLDLLDPATGEAVTVYVNGATTEVVAVDLGIVPRPSEIAGFMVPLRHVQVGGAKWHLPSADADDSVKNVEEALESGTVKRLDVRDPASGGSVALLLNGKAASTVTTGTGGVPRPSEIAGG
ncbi:MAG TPA: hypothetical protein VL551_31585 [Actinospica sp.]|jgi:hypothetical protein|nr:hypothetical protein [Actinospica sp.]